MDERTRTSIRTARAFAEVLMDDENQDRQLVAEGLVKMLDDIDIDDGRMVRGLRWYVRQYTRSDDEEATRLVDQINAIVAVEV